MKAVSTRGAKSAFKRALTLGSVWEAFHHGSESSLGVRPVSIVQTNGVAFRTDRGTDSWLYFDDKDTGFVLNDDGSFSKYYQDEKLLTYKEVKA